MSEMAALYAQEMDCQSRVDELVRVLGKAAGQALAPAYAAPREGDIYRSALSNAAARRNLGWTPKVTLEEGLRRTYAYVKETAAQ